MRIISGTFGGRILHPPKNLPVRPTTDYARTALFNILNHRLYFEDIAAIDLFAGTGAVSIELASRGCRDITSVDKHAGCTGFILQTIKAWDIKGIRCVKDEVFRFLEKCPYKADFIFADPPYELPDIEKIPALVFSRELLRPGGLLIVEHGDKTTLDQLPHFEEHRRYGNVNFSIFGAPQ